MTKSDVPIRATKHTLEVIEAVRRLDDARVSTLAEELDMPTSTVHDYLKTLETQEYLLKENGSYELGARFLELGEEFRGRKKVYTVARPEIKRLAEQTGEHANLMIEEHGRGIFMYKARGDDAVQLDTRPGMRVHLQTTALGKAIMAHLPEETVDSIIETHGLPAVTENSITDRETLYSELDSVRDRGYAMDDEERVDGMRCVAAPITDSDGIGIAAVSVSAPKSRMVGEDFQETYPELVMRSANVIEVNLTHL